jgi:putative SOS response-associated peptidase YedK
MRFRGDRGGERRCVLKDERRPTDLGRAAWVFCDERKTARISFIMCGRVRLSSDYSEIKIKLKFDPASPAPNYAADWNKPPTEPMLVAIRSMDGARVPKMMKWGLIPHWSKDSKLQYSTINARSEDFRTKPAFRDAWQWGQRCLVITDGFYEWKKLDPKGKEKQPYAIAMANNMPTVMAGLWAKWKSPEGEQVLSCTILTCGPNSAMGELHDRMPVILDEAGRQAARARRLARASPRRPCCRRSSRS